MKNFPSVQCACRSTMCMCKVTYCRRSMIIQTIVGHLQWGKISISLSNVRALCSSNQVFTRHKWTVEWNSCMKFLDILYIALWFFLAKYKNLNYYILKKTYFRSPFKIDCVPDWIRLLFCILDSAEIIFVPSLLYRVIVAEIRLSRDIRSCSHWDSCILLFYINFHYLFYIYNLHVALSFSQILL